MSSKTKKSGFPRNFSFFFSVLFLIFYFTGVFKHLEDVWTDRLFRIRKGSLALGDPKIILAAIDVDTGQKYSFPLPRIVHAQLLDRLKSCGVKTVVFDVMFL